MKRKGTDHFSSDKVLQKDNKYVSQRSDEEVADLHGEDVKTSKPLRKATERDKERKRERARLKRQKKRELKRSQGTSNNSNAKIEALAYLKAWKKDRSQWAFNKNKQVWLLRNVYNIDNISDKHFKVMLKYLVGLQGVARERLIQEAESKVNCAENSDDKTDEKEDGPRNTDTDSKEKIQKVVERARSILQMVV